MVHHYVEEASSAECISAAFSSAFFFCKKHNISKRAHILCPKFDLSNLKLHYGWNTTHLLSVCLCPEPFRCWLLMLYSVLSREVRVPFVTQLASMHPWGSCNLPSSGGGSGGGGRSKKKWDTGKEHLNFKKELFVSIFIVRFLLKNSFLSFQKMTAFSHFSLCFLC